MQENSKKEHTQKKIQFIFFIHSSIIDIKKCDILSCTVLCINMIDVVYNNYKIYNFVNEAYFSTTERLQDSNLTA